MYESMAGHGRTCKIVRGCARAYEDSKSFRGNARVCEAVKGQVRLCNCV